MNISRWRHLIVAAGIIPAIAIYVILCLVLADFITGIHVLVDLIYYVIAGLAWIFPAAKVIRWLADHEAY